MELGTLTTGNTLSEEVTSNNIYTGDIIITCGGTWSSATVTVEQEVNGTWESLLDHAYTEDFAIVLTVGWGTKVRLVLTGGTSPSLPYTLA